MRSDRGRIAEGLAREVVHTWRAHPEAGEAERDQAEHAGLRTDVVGREVVALGDRLVPAEGAGPILAEQCTLVRELARVAVGESHAVTGREEQRRCLLTAEEVP